MYRNQSSHKVSPAHHLVLGLLVSAFAMAASAEDRSVFVDEFDGLLDLDWEIIRPDEEGFSFETNPGELTLLTLRGSIWNSNERSYPVANIFLLNQPIDATDSFDATLHISSFKPSALYQQVGLILYQSDHDYLKLTMEYRANKEPPTAAITTHEVGNKATNPGPVPFQNDGPFWLRMRSTESGKYILEHSNDGDAFTLVSEQEWAPAGNGPVRMGFLAKRGPANSPSIPAVIESFRMTLSK